MNFNQLGKNLRKKYPQLHDQEDFYNGKEIFALRLVSLEKVQGEYNPKYELIKTVFQSLSK